MSFIEPGRQEEDMLESHEDVEKLSIAPLKGMNTHIHFFIATCRGSCKAKKKVTDFGKEKGPGGSTSWSHYTGQQLLPKGNKKRL